MFCDSKDCVFVGFSVRLFIWIFLIKGFNNLFYVGYKYVNYSKYFYCRMIYSIFFFKI